MQNNIKGVYVARKKDNSIYYRASITCKGKHISLGSYEDADTAGKAYLEADMIWKNNTITIDCYSTDMSLSFEKYISLINYRDNGMYFANPIYLRPKFFYYYLNPVEILKFDVDDLFYYSSHKIMRRGNHYFVADYGMQVNIASRYGIKNHAVIGKDYQFLNGDRLDFRYSNIQILNTYYGVSIENNNNKTIYKSVIHINGNFIIGRFESIEKAAIAYNKAADYIKSLGCTTNFEKNYISELNQTEYQKLYNEISLPDKIINYRLP